MSFMKGVEHLKIPLRNLRKATHNFSEGNLIGRGGFGRVYDGVLNWRGCLSMVAIKRLDRGSCQGDREFLMEIAMLSCYKHKNVITLVGYCDENDEKIIVYEHATHGSLDKLVVGKDLSWMQRLQVCFGAAHGLHYLHHDVGSLHRVLHRDIKSSNILLDKNWEARISDFGLSKIGPANFDITFLVTHACGTFGYVDPLYVETGVLTKESDVYSFGVVLFEVLCSRLACIAEFNDSRRFLAPLAQSHYEKKVLKEIIDPNLWAQMEPASSSMFSEIAYECLKENRNERPRMDQVVEALEIALHSQQGTTIGPWGGTGGSPWSLKPEGKITSIYVEYGERIDSITFAYKDNDGIQHTSRKFGGNDGIYNETINFGDEEEISKIGGTFGPYSGTQGTLRSLMISTNENDYGPYGHEVGTNFLQPVAQGKILGFYGRCGVLLDAIGVYTNPT